MSNANEPAFPIQDRQGHEVFNKAHFGLTKREQIAAMALQGAISNPGNEGVMLPQVVEGAVKFADALLAELARTNV